MSGDVLSGDVGRCPGMSGDVRGCSGMSQRDVRACHTGMPRMSGDVIRMSEGCHQDHIMSGSCRGWSDFMPGMRCVARYAFWMARRFCIDMTSVPDAMSVS